MRARGGLVKDGRSPERKPAPFKSKGAAPAKAVAGWEKRRPFPRQAGGRTPRKELRGGGRVGKW